MRAGRLRTWLTFQKRAVDIDSDGEAGQIDDIGNRIERWEDAFAASSRMPAEVVATSGRELMAAAAAQSRVSHRITVRYRTGFDAGMRAVDPDGTIYNLEAIIPDRETGRNSITFLASTGVNEG